MTKIETKQFKKDSKEPLEVEIKDFHGVHMIKEEDMIDKHAKQVKKEEEDDK